MKDAVKVILRDIDAALNKVHVCQYDKKKLSTVKLDADNINIAATVLQSALCRLISKSISFTNSFDDSGTKSTFKVLIGAQRMAQWKKVIFIRISCIDLN